MAAKEYIERLKVIFKSEKKSLIIDRDYWTDTYDCYNRLIYRSYKINEFEQWWINDISDGFFLYFDNKAHKEGYWVSFENGIVEDPLVIFTLYSILSENLKKKPYE